MSNWWFVFAVIMMVVLSSGVVLALTVVRVALAQRERETLTMTDLTAIEESAMLLIDQLKSEADRGIVELDKRCAVLKELITEADRRLLALKEAVVSIPAKEEAVNLECGLPAIGDRGRVIALAEGGLNSAEIAKITGLDCAEVKLVLSLSKLPAS